MEGTVSVYNTVPSNLIAADASSKANAVEEDILDNCWTAPPCSVYSRTDTDSTQSLTISAIIVNNRSPTKQAKRTNAIEKAADDIASAGKKAQEKCDKQFAEDEKTQKEAIKEVEKRHYAALIEAETKQLDPLIAFKMQMEEATRNIISENFDKLLQQSGEIKAKIKDASVNKKKRYSKRLIPN
eukprot:15180721-Ditylum_brightwellii.AAC.1